MKLRGVVALVALAAALVRVPALLHGGIWRDEANVYVELMAPSFGDFLHRVAAIDYHPPLYFLLEYLWARIAGLNEFAFESMPLAFSVATVPVLYALGKAAGSKAAGVVASVFFAVAPLAVSYGTDYIYPLAIFANACLTLQVTIARRSAPTFESYALTAGASLLAIYSHYTALVLIPLLIVWALLSPSGIKHGARVAGALVAGALPFVLWLPVFLHQHHVGLPYHNPAQPGQSVTFALTALALLAPVPASLAVVAIFAAALVPAILALSRSSLQSDCAAIGAIALAAIATVSAIGGLTAVRYVLPFCTLLYVFVAWLFVSLAAKVRRDDLAAWSRWGVPLTALFAAALVVADVRSAILDGRTPFSGMRTFLRSIPPDARTLYLIAPDYVAPDFAYYSRGTNARFIGFARLNHPEYYVLDDYEQLWNDPALMQRMLQTIAAQPRKIRYLDVVADSWAHDSYRIPFGKVHQLVAELERRYPLVSRSQYAGRWEPITVYRFEMIRSQT